MRRWLLLLAGLSAVAAAAACSSSDDTASTSTTATSTTTSSGGSIGSLDTGVTGGTTSGSADGEIDPLGECPHKMPSDLLTADEAVVRFSPTRICPGYVTISNNTPVTFVNVGMEPSTVTITSGIAASAEAEPIEQHELAPGERWAWTVPGTGTYTFRSTAIPSFTGTIEAVG